MTLWSKRFEKNGHELLETYNASINFDKELIFFDIQVSIAHVTMLAENKIISLDDKSLLINGLDSISDDFKKKKINFCAKDEDIHMKIETLLYDKVGDVAGKLHTGRSRNDQVATDLRLYMRYHTYSTIERLTLLINVLVNLSEEHIDTILPGYTHLQRAEPIRLAHHLLAYANMFCRDVARLKDSLHRINVSPLGAGALAGSGFAIDTEYSAKLLQFESCCNNSLDAVSDRDFVVEYLSSASLIMMHISRLSEEIILWSSQEFGFIELDDAFCTGSSMMPQKKNPDVVELARGKTGRVYGSLISMLTVLKGLPLAYNKDLQEDKEGLFDTVKTVIATLDIFTPLLSSMYVNKDKMRQALYEGYVSATQIANYLVTKGVPFRETHDYVSQMVLYCIQYNKSFSDLTLHEYQSFHSAFSQDIFDHIDPVSVIESKRVLGGTSRKSIEYQLQKMREALSHYESYLKVKV